MAARQNIRFCTTVDGVRIAYSTMGDGPPLVIPPQLVTHLEADLVEGPLADVYEALARRHTLVRFDMRGTGLSDRDAPLSSGTPLRCHRAPAPRSCTARCRRP